MSVQIILNYAVLVPMIAVMFLLTKLIADFNLKQSLGFTQKNWVDYADHFNINKTPILVRRSGLFLGVLIATFAVFQNTFIDRSTYEMLYHVIAEAGLVLVFMFTALKIADKVVFGKVNNDAEVINNNVSIALVEASILIGTGLSAYGSILGTGPLWTSIVFFVIGQIAFIGTVWIYEKFQMNIRTDIIKNKLIQAINLSSFIIVTAIAIKTGIAGNYTGMVPDLTYLAFVFTIMMASVIYFMVIERLIFNNVKDEIGTAIIKAILRIAYISITSITLLNSI